MVTSSLDSRSDPIKGYIGAGVERALSHFYPDYRTESEIFHDRVSRYLTRDSVVLDAGCGSGDFFPYSWKHQVKLLVGCDAAGQVASNPNLVCGALANL